MTIKMISYQYLQLPNIMTKITAEMIEIMQKNIITAMVAFSLLAVSTWLTPAGKEREGNFSLAIMEIVGRKKNLAIFFSGNHENCEK